VTNDDEQKEHCDTQCPNAYKSGNPQDRLVIVAKVWVRSLGPPHDDNRAENGYHCNTNQECREDNARQMSQNTSSGETWGKASATPQGERLKLLQ
jgi:hypothetical protein